MSYTVEIKLDKKVVYEIEVEADSPEQAMEFAYEQFEMNSNAEVK